MTIAEYLDKLQSNYPRLIYGLLNEKLFTAVGLELSDISVFFEDDSTFALVGRTFGYFNPIDNSIHINAQHPFIMNGQNETHALSVLFVLFHEVMHKILLHTDRQGERDQLLWNLAGDAEIHNVLYGIADLTKEGNPSQFRSVFERMQEMFDNWSKKDYMPAENSAEIKAVFHKELIENTAEEIYTILKNQANIEKQEFTMSLSDFMKNFDQDQNQQDQNQQGQEGDEDQNQQGQGQQGKNQQGQGQQGKNQQGQGKQGKNQQGQGKQGKNQQGQGKQGKNQQGQEGDEDQNQQGGDANEPKVKITVSKITLNGKIIENNVNIEWPKESELPKELQKSEEEKKTASNNAQLRRQIFQEEAKTAAERNRGEGNCRINKLINKIFEIKIDWAKILKSSLQTALAKSDYFTWSKPRMSTMTLGMYLPSIAEDLEKYGTLIIARDESGSMSDEDIAKTVDIVKSSKEYYKKIIIIKHDTEIVSTDEFEEIDDDAMRILCTRNACGGTSHKAVFEWIKDFSKKHQYDEESISSAIFITDMESDIEEYQNILPERLPVFYITPAEIANHTRVNGKIIKVG